MADNVLNKRFFTNTYITGSGRHNYLRIDHLEDPLFTSFTFDIDYVTSPLFYTINYSDYEYPNVEGLGERIEEALNLMHAEMSHNDGGYDILPVFSASILDGNKLGFGLQQNVYMDLPLYGATEYIYMVDKRNGGANQNDAGYDSNSFLESGANPNTLNSYKLGDSIKSIVNDSDRAWAERKKQQNEDQILACEEIMKNENVVKTHDENKVEMEQTYQAFVNANSRSVFDPYSDPNTKNYTEAELLKEVNDLKKLDEEFEYFKREIVEWANDILSSYKNRGTAIYNGNKCVQKILSYDDIDSNYHVDELEKEFGDDFREKYLFEDDDSYLQQFCNLYRELETYADGVSKPDPAHLAYTGEWYSFFNDDEKSFLLDRNGTTDGTTIRASKVIEKFRNKLEYFDILKKSSMSGYESLTSDVMVYVMEAPDWAYQSYQSYLSNYDAKNTNHNFDNFIEWTMGFKCDIESAFDENFASDKIKKNELKLGIYEDALEQIRYNLYGIDEKTRQPCTSANPSPDSPYGQYLAAKEKYENDDYSQAEKAKLLAQSGVNQMTSMIGRDEYNQEIKDENYNESIKKDVQPLEVSRNKSIVVSQTVLDMLGFISGMKKMTMNYPYVIQGISGLDTAYNKHYGIKDPYLGSGDDKITLTCLESLDLRVSSMFNRYLNAVYDRQYRRERVPVNLRRFNCTVYVHDVRNFMPKDRVDKNGNRIVTYNRLLELTDMYYSVIEFRFYDCEIVPEETGNIFSDVSNESPSEMKKTNFTFTYGNCVVNFVPQSEVAAHKTSKPRI